MRPPKQVRPTVDQNAYLIERDAFYQRLPAQYVQNRRLEDQAKLLEAYKKDPEGFLESIRGSRTDLPFRCRHRRQEHGPGRDVR